MRLNDIPCAPLTQGKSPSAYVIPSGVACRAVALCEGWEGTPCAIKKTKPPPRPSFASMLPE
jgi:hypothetical protein